MAHRLRLDIGGTAILRRPLPGKNKIGPARRRNRYLVEEGGFEPPKRNATDLQSAPFGHSGTPPYVVGAGGRIRTPDLLITNQLLYQLSYTSTAASAFTTMMIITAGGGFVNSFFKKEQKNERMEEPRQERSLGRTGSSGAACAGGSCTPATPTSPWRAGRCVSTAWGGMPGAISPPSFAGWGGARLRRARTLFEKRSRENDL